jgi:hypothetical protein
MALFTLAFIFSYDIDVGYRQTLSIAALSAAWPGVLLAIVFLLALVFFLQLRDAGKRPAASQRREWMPWRAWQESLGRKETIRQGDLAEGVEAGTWRRWADAMRAHR